MKNTSGKKFNQNLNDTLKQLYKFKERIKF